MTLKKIYHNTNAPSGPTARRYEYVADSGICVCLLLVTAEDALIDCASSAMPFTLAEAAQAAAEMAKKLDVKMKKIPNKLAWTLIDPDGAIWDHPAVLEADK